MMDIYNTFNSNAPVGATSQAGEPPPALNTHANRRRRVADAAEHPAGSLREVRRAVQVLNSIFGARGAPDTWVEPPRYASIAFAEPPRFAERVTYETASNPSNATGSNHNPSAAR